MNYSQLLDTYIKKSGLSLAKIAERMEKEKGIKIDRSYISKLRNSPKYPASEDVNRAMAEITGGDPEALITAAYYETAPDEVKKSLDKGVSYDRIIEFIFTKKDSGEMPDPEASKQLEHLLSRSPSDAEDKIGEYLNNLMSERPDYYVDLVTSSKTFAEVDKEYAKLLRKLRINNDISTREMANKLDVSEQLYVDIENYGGLGKSDENSELNQAYNLAIEILQNSNENFKVAEGITPYDASEQQRIPVLGSIRAGQPIERLEYNEGYTLVDPELIRGRESFALRVKGNSMSGDRIEEGDLVIVVRQEEVHAHEIAVVAIDNDEATLKRVKRQGDMCMLIPSNPAMTPDLYPCSKVKIIGKVVEIKIRPK